MSLINMASRAAPVVSRAFIGLAIAAAAGVGLSQTLAAEPDLGSGSVFTANEGGGSLSRIDLEVRQGTIRDLTADAAQRRCPVPGRGSSLLLVPAKRARCPCLAKPPVPR
uniref:hypothetical protein n=1 Tax=Mesorhizobium atlanticum TaxID=2233532 RepID=UPI003703CEFC